VLGRPSTVATTIDGTTHTIASTYDAASRVSTVAYPSGLTVAYGYNATGYQSQLKNAATSQVYWTANARDAEGHLTQATAGNGLVTAQSFEATTGRLLGIVTGAGGAVQNFAYTYDTLGRLASRSDGNAAIAETFGYDALSRLTSATVNLTPTPLAKTFAYDAIGNLTAKSDVGTYSYPAPGGVRPHAVSSIRAFQT
jgi:YD repeat-containing protein